MTTKQTKADLIDENARLNKALIEEVEARAQFEQDVVDKALSLARSHGWCQVVERGLRSMGLGHRLPHTFEVHLGVRDWDSVRCDWVDRRGFTRYTSGLPSVRQAKRESTWGYYKRDGRKMKLVEVDGNGKVVRIVEKANY